MLPPVPCVAPLSCSVSSTHPGRSPSVWTRTAAWALLSGACAGRSSQQTTTSNIWKSGHRSLSFLSVDSCSLSRMYLLFQCVLGPSVDPGSTAGVGEQCITVACSRQPVQSARHVLLVLSHGDVHQRTGFTDRSATGQFLFSCWTVSLRGNDKPQRFSCTKLKRFSSNSPFPCGAVALAP